MDQIAEFYVVFVGCGVNRLVAFGLAAFWGIQSALVGPARAAESNSPGVTKDSVVIGSCCVLSGPTAKLGSQQLVGANAYINEINSKGGILGRTIKLKGYDDKYEAASAPKCFQQALSDNCFAGAFFVGSMPAKAYIPLIERNSFPVIGFLTGAEVLTKPLHSHVFAVRSTYRDELAAVIDGLWKDLGAKKVAIISQSESSIPPDVLAALAAHKATPVVMSKFPHNTLDVDDAIATARAAKPDVVVLCGPYLPLAEIVKRSHAKGWFPQFITPSFVGTEEFIEAAGKDAEGTVISQVLPPYNRDDLSTVSLYKRLLQKYYPKEKPNFTSFEGFVDAMVLCHGLQAAGKNLTRASFVSALESIHDKDMGLGSKFKLTFNSKRHQGFDSVFTTVVRGGQPIAFFNWKLLGTSQ